MPKSNFFMVHRIFHIVALLYIAILCQAEVNDTKEYIVYMGSLPKGGYSPAVKQYNIMQQLMDGSLADSPMIRSYKRSFSGFAAKLTQQEANKLASMEGVISVFPSMKYQLHTTRSWDFIGFTQNVKRIPTVESDIIVGVIDTGIWPESQSFSDEGFGPPPKKWRGTCDGGANFTCNNKLIGARNYVDSSKTARDSMGHGTHTASTVAGSVVDGASFFELAHGTARGAVPSARIAAYKVCNENGCDAADILAAFDDAIADGVDIISLSVGGGPTRFDLDAIAIGTFHAMERGILTSQSAGNAGPFPESVGSVAPWTLSVAASSIDRKFISKVILGNGTTLTGAGINSFPSNMEDVPLLHGLELANKGLCDEDGARLCQPECLDKEKVKGKIVLCDDYGGRFEASFQGALGAILNYNINTSDVSDVLPLRSSTQEYNHYESILSYHDSTKNPRGRILKGETVKDYAAPKVASFSSRGPNSILPDILKPDITAPGLEILAAFPPSVSPSSGNSDFRRVNYSFMSGTSMSCPHVTGVAAYIKSFHPHWSPSAIKSAMMTTAWPMNDTASADREWGYGAGHINPIKALSPGLVYETSKYDYLNLLCSLGYNITFISGTNVPCDQNSTKIAARDLNYPSISTMVTPNKTFAIEVTRTVTNVGHANSTYKTIISTGPKLSIAVHPEVLSFKSLNETKSFIIKLSGKALLQAEAASASIVWTDGAHNVRSPIVVYASFPSSP